MKQLVPLVCILSFMLAPLAYAHEADVEAHTQLDADRPLQIRDSIRSSFATSADTATTDARARIQLHLEGETRNAGLHMSATGTASTTKDERREEAAEKREERRAHLAEAMQERLENFLDRTLARFNAAIDRLNNMADRIQSRIEKFAERGLDVSESETLLAEARTHIDAAGDAILTVEASIEAALDSDTPREALQEVRGLFVEARGAIREAHQALVAVIVDLKQGLLELQADVEADTATTTDDGTEDDSDDDDESDE